MSVKKNFKQALDEIVGGQTASQNSRVIDSRATVRSSDLKPSYVPAAGTSPVQTPVQTPVAAAAAMPLADSPPAVVAPLPQDADAAGRPSRLAGSPPAASPAAAPISYRQPGSVQPVNPTGSELTLITAGTILQGNLITTSSLDIQGTIRGDVNSEGNIKVTGRIEGNVTCENIELINAQVIGRIEARQTVIIRGSSVHIGDISSDRMDVDGKIKGNLQAVNSLLLHQNAYILGDLATRSIQVEFGAVIQGIVNTTSDVNDSSCFQAVSQVKA